jgi:hypothetical protein
MIAERQPVESAEAASFMNSPTTALARPELPQDVRDLVFAYMRIGAPGVRRAALRAVQAMARP